jgi:hypothetical protein
VGGVEQDAGHGPILANDFVEVGVGVGLVP